MAESYAKLPRKLWELVDAKERNRRILRPETYRGALADLCIAIDNSRDKSIDYNPRYWGMRWEWHHQEVKRLLDELLSTRLFTLEKKPGERGQRIIASFSSCEQFVSSLCQVCEQDFQPWQGKGGRIVSSLCRVCAEFVSKVPTTNYQSIEPDGSSLPPPAKAVVPYQKILAIYHEVLAVLPVCQVLSDARKKLIRSRWKEAEERRELTWWREYFTRVKGCDFLCGRVDPSPGRQAWLADLEWLVRPSNMIKVLEGKYDNHTGVRQVETEKVIEVCGNCKNWRDKNRYTGEVSCSDRQINDPKCGDFRALWPSQIRVK